jgi:zinc and cadmium transporter
MFLHIILATILVSLVAILPIVFLISKKNILQTKYIVSLAAGVILAFSWLELLPEVFTNYDPEGAGQIVLLTIIAMFVIELFFHWHHCSNHDCHDLERKPKHLIFFNLIGDGIHNFIDGAIIASAFMADFRLGVITTLVVIVHEIPQEIADAGILLYAGLSKKKVIFFNFIFGLTAVLGATLTFFFINNFQNALTILLAIAAGNFIYIALSDLIPIIHHESDKNIFKQIFWFLLGIIIIYSLTALSYGH